LFSFLRGIEFWVRRRFEYARRQLHRLEPDKGRVRVNSGVSLRYFDEGRWFSRDHVTSDVMAEERANGEEFRKSVEGEDSNPLSTEQKGVARLS
jgi:hypothetical protein